MVRRNIYAYYFTTFKKWVRFDKNKIYFAYHENDATLSSKPNILKKMLQKSSFKKQKNFVLKNYEKFVLKKIELNMKNNTKIKFPDGSIIYTQLFSENEQEIHVAWTTENGVEFSMWLPSTFKCQ